MANTYDLLQTINVAASSSQTTLTFSSIPSTYKDLAIRISCKSTSTAGEDTLGVRFNGDSGSNYHTTLIQGYGSAGQSGAVVGVGTLAWTGLITDNQSSTSTWAFNSTNLYIPNYSGSNPKGFMANSYDEGTPTAALMRMFKNKWTGTAAIDSITFTILSGGAYNFGQYTNAYLYGIK
jgi:hypothetical protein